MILGSLVVALMLQAAPVADSTDFLPWYRRESSVDARLMPDLAISSADDTLPRRRPKAVSYSDWYYRRLQIHRWGSYVELPLFAGEYWLGNKLLSRDQTPGSWVKPAHVAVATGLGALFTVNTVTGLWNLYESRQSTDDRALVWTHTALMLASDAGFAITGAIGGDARRNTAGQNRHRNAGLVSFGVATVGTGIMWAARGF